ncbi:VOC family protein [uncultured Sphingomonas sp.]|uniref:VOC family protein n=1 Tax=uncultured Sphingomonas sp. TaxID=158754 RepID=UPI0035CBF80B
MSGRSDHGPTGGVAPHLTVHDGRCREAIAFYERAFGAERAMPPMVAGDMPRGEGMPDMGGDARIMHAHLRINGGSLMMNDAFPEFVAPADRSAPDSPSAVTLHLQVDDADHWFARAVEAGAEATMPLSDMFWGDRYGQLRDPFGHRWSIGSAIKGAKA